MGAPQHFTQTIRASSTPNALDCLKRFAADNIQEFRELCLLEKDAEQSKLRPFALVFGSSAHFGSQLMLTEKRDTGRFSVDNAIGHAIEYMKAEVLDVSKQIVKWDAYAGNDEDGARQLRRVLNTLAEDYVFYAQPYLIEHEAEILWSHEWECECTQWIAFETNKCRCGRIREQLEISPRTRKVILTGHWDVLGYDGWLDDTKFGALGAGYQPQGGSYLWLAQPIVDQLILRELLPENFLLKGFREVWAKRTKEKTVAVKVKERSFNGCVVSAEQAVNRAALARYQWEETKDPNVFETNSNSKYCTEKTCKAYGTSQCDQWIGNAQDKETEQENDKWVM